MLKNYLTTAFRNLWRSKASAIINVSGLTLGITTSLILFLLVRHQASFDNYHAKRDRIYRVVRQSDGNNGKDYSAGVPAVLPTAFRTDFNEAEEVTFTSYSSDDLILIPQKNGEDKKYSEKAGVTFAEANFFKMFDRKILMGDAAKGLDEPNEAIISRKLALKYFGVEDAIGQVLKRDDKEYRITAVMEDAPANTDFPFELMLSYSTIQTKREENGWNSTWSDEQCYFLLKSSAKLADMEKQIPAFTEKYLGKDNTDHATFLLQPLSEIHYDDRFGNYNYSTTSQQMLTALSVIGIFLIITACINFINLVTAEAIKRSKEVGIRKALGSSRLQLIGQFLGESSLVTVFAVLMAIAFAQMGLSFLNPFLKLSLSLNFLSDGGLWIFLIAVSLSVAVLSGLYPSLVVSGFKPVFAIKNQIDNKNSSGYLLRKGLVVMQFFISQFFIIGTIVLISQMNYFSNKDLGFKKDAIITVPIPQNDNEAAHNKMKALREELSRLNGIEMASMSNTPPSSGSVSGTDFVLEGKDVHYGTQVKVVDGNYISLYGLELVAGTNVLDLDTARGFLVNEKLATMVGFDHPQDIVGKNIKMWGKTRPIVGVIKNFHTMSLHEPIEATIMLNRIRGYRTLSLKINAADAQQIIKQVQQKWEATYPEFLFSYQFLDEQIKEFYDREQKMSVLLTLFTSIAIFIGCLGLFGLATFMANQKTKEIGVRKVLGASVESIVFSFSKEYVKLIVIGFVLAAPAAWYVMNQWLKEFAYKITLGPSIFLAGLAITFLIAIVTVGYRSFKAALANPAQSLKSE